MYCDGLMGSAKTSDQWAAEEQAHATELEAAQIKRAADWAQTLRDRADKAKNHEQGSVAFKKGWCPTEMSEADKLELEERLTRLFGGSTATRSRGWVYDQLNAEAAESELLRLCGLCMASVVAEPEPDAQQLHAELDKFMQRYYNTPSQRGQTDSVDEMLEALDPPTACEGCRCGKPCCVREVESLERVTQEEMSGLDLAACGWTVVVIGYALRKRNLLRMQRSAASFAALVNVGVWPAGEVPTDIHAMLPTFSSLDRPELVVLFNKVLAAEAAHCDAWNWEAVSAGTLAEELSDPSDLEAAAVSSTVSSVLSQLEESEWGMEGDRPDDE